MIATVFGANGATGRLVTTGLLDAGVEVRAVTRHPDAFPHQHERLHVLAGDATRYDDVKQAIAGADVVLSTLGVRFTRQRVTLYSASAELMVGLMQDHGPDRLVVTSSAGLEPDLEGASWWERRALLPLVERLGRTVYTDMRRMEQTVSSSRLRWTILRPLALTNTEAHTGYATRRDSIPGRFTARQHLARVMVDEVTGDGHPHQRVAICTPMQDRSLVSTTWHEGVRPNLPGRGRARRPGTA
ncbi:NAD(P)-dependent oxidoreductase [Kytococcus sp. Marseille-QA3725]